MGRETGRSRRLSDNIKEDQEKKVGKNDVWDKIKWK